MRPRRLAAAFVVASLILLAPSARTARAQQTDNLSYVLTLFGQYLEALRQQTGIPGLSAAIVSNRQIIWEAGYGFADVEAAVRATPDTPYIVADLTQAVAASVVLQCVEAGVDLDNPMSRFTTRLPAGATIRHALSHATDAPPGRSFRYDPSRFSALTEMAESCYGTPLRKRLATAVLDHLAMIDSVPGTDLVNRSAVPGGMFSDGTHARYEAVLRRRAKTYRGSREGRPTATSVARTALTASDGLVTTVRDLAKFSAGLDDGDVLEDDTLSLTWRNATTDGGQALPTGLGWFVQSYNGTRLVWHFGRLADGASSILIKAPDRDITLILLANSEGVSEGLEHGDVTTSLFARLFLRLFI